MRELVTIRTITSLNSIPGADFIEAALVDGWEVVVKKGDFQVGEPVLYFEIDSVLPVHSAFEFLRKSSFVNRPFTTGFRLKTIKLKKQISQGLLLPLSTLDLFPETEPDQNLADRIGVVLWDPPVDPTLRGSAKSNFPSFITKTDQERVQNVRKATQGPYHVTEKLDGSSMTVYLRDDTFGVCSRNLELQEEESNAFWTAAKNQDLERKLRRMTRVIPYKNIAMQGELIGPSIQKNPYKQWTVGFNLFDIFDIDTQKYLDMKLVEDIAYAFDIDMVPVIKDHPFTDEFNFGSQEGRRNALEFVSGIASALNRDSLAEGIVVRSMSSNFSCKVINNKWLLEEE